MAKFPEAEARLFKERFVCRRCHAVIHAPSRKIAEGVIKCRKCHSTKFKAKRKK